MIIKFIILFIIYSCSSREKIFVDATFEFECHACFMHFRKTWKVHFLVKNCNPTSIPIDEMAEILSLIVR